MVAAHKTYMLKQTQKTKQTHNKSSKKRKNMAI